SGMIAPAVRAPAASCKPSGIGIMMGAMPAAIMASVPAVIVTGPPGGVISVSVPGPGAGVGYAPSGPERNKSPGPGGDVVWLTRRAELAGGTAAEGNASVMVPGALVMASIGVAVVPLAGGGAKMVPSMVGMAPEENPAKARRL